MGLGPGFLNWMKSTPSGTAQPLPLLARNKVGRASTPASSFKLLADDCVPWILTVEHFMYISRLPMRLNHDQATTALPEGRPAGTSHCNGGSM